MENKIGLTVLGSGSGGNCTLVHSGDDAVLIDAGFSLKETRHRIESAGLSELKIHGILVTHEHTDHIKGVRVCANYFHAPIFATMGCSMEIRAIDSRIGQIVRICPGGKFDLGCFTITPFSIPHDARDPVGYIVSCNDVKIGVATDIGYASSGVEYELRNCHSMLLESNHDIQLLAASSRPWNVKQRILSRIGHLCNDAASELLKKIVGPSTKNIVLGHISHECNSSDIALRCGQCALHEIGRDDINLEIAKQDEPLSTIWCEL